MDINENSTIESITNLKLVRTSSYSSGDIMFSLATKIAKIGNTRLRFKTNLN